MTRRDVAVWFCKVLGLAGISGAVFRLLSAIGIFILMKYPGNLAAMVPSLVVYLFLFLFAQGIGTELAAEGDDGPPLTAKAELGALLLRCVGLWLLLNASISFTHSAVQIGLEMLRPSMVTAPAFVVSLRRADALSSFLLSALGFGLAFGPRIRGALQPR